MCQMDFAKYMKESKQVLQRVEQMKDKVKALILLDTHEKKWHDSIRHIRIQKDTEVYDIYTDLLNTYLVISKSLTDSEGVRYGNTLPDEILEQDWCKKQCVLY